MVENIIESLQDAAKQVWLCGDEREIMELGNLITSLLFYVTFRNEDVKNILTLS